jgi:hypothetical protein
MSRYYWKMHELGYELAALLFQESGKEEILADLQGLGETEWIKWMLANHEMVLRFLQAGPASRTKRWKDKQTRRRLNLAALLLNRYAITLRDVVERYGASNGQSYRDAHTEAADLGLRCSFAFLDCSLYPSEEVLDSLEEMAQGISVYNERHFHPEFLKMLSS